MPKGRVPYPFGKCTVCSDQATGNHYGAITCEGCKGFFKRSLGKSHTYRCRGSYNCSVGTDNRIKCKACRFKRCKELGMSMSAIKMGRIPKAEKLRALESAYGDLAIAAATAGSSSMSSSSAVGSGTATAAAPAVGSASVSAERSNGSPSNGVQSCWNGDIAEGVAAAAACTAGSLPAAALDSVTAAGADVDKTYAASATNVAGTVGLGAADAADCMDEFEAVLDLSSRSTCQPSLQHGCSGLVAPGRNGPIGAMRQLTVVNSLIAKHVRALDGAASAAGRMLNGTAVNSAMTELGTAPRCANDDRGDVAGPGLPGTASQRLSAGRCRRSMPVPAEAASLGIAEGPILTATGSSSSSSSSSAVGGGRYTQASSYHSSSSNDNGSDASEPGSESGDGTAVASPLTAAPACELLPSKTLSETVQALSCAYLKMSAATRRCIDVMSHHVTGGQDGPEMQSVSDDGQFYALEQVMVSFDLLGNKLMGFIKSCPGLSTLWIEDVLLLAKRAYLSIWLVLESPLFRDGESHMLLPNGRRHGRSWMHLYLPDALVERMHAYAKAQVAARLTVPELGLMCGLLLTSYHGSQSLSDEGAVTRLNSVFTQALSYEVHRGRLHPHRILATIWRLLAILQDVNDSHEALSRCGDGCSSSSHSGAGTAAQSQPDGY